MAAIDCPRSNAPIKLTSLAVIDSRLQYRLPEERSEKGNHNQDEASRLAIKVFVVVGGQPVGIAHVRLLGRPPANGACGINRPELPGRSHPGNLVNFDRIGWWWTQSGQTGLPGAISLSTGKKQGNFIKSDDYRVS
jgi:hypothetical protein